MHKVTIDKAITTAPLQILPNTQNPRVEKLKSQPKTNANSK
jgi:hypothetical protein